VAFQPVGKSIDLLKFLLLANSTLCRYVPFRWRHGGRLLPPLGLSGTRPRQRGMYSMPSTTKRFVDGAMSGRHYDDKLPGFGLYGARAMNRNQSARRCGFMVVAILLGSSAEALAQEAFLGAGCPLDLPPNIGGTCDFLNQEAATGRLDFRFSAGRNDFGVAIDKNVILTLIGSVMLLSSRGDTSTGKVKFRVPIREVHARALGDQVALECNGDQKCIEVQYISDDVRKDALAATILRAEYSGDVASAINKLNY
jgi:hypothetical protein